MLSLKLRDSLALRPVRSSGLPLLTWTCPVFDGVACHFDFQLQLPGDFQHGYSADTHPPSPFPPVLAISRLLCHLSSLAPRIQKHLDPFKGHIESQGCLKCQFQLPLLGCALLLSFILLKSSHVSPGWGGLLPSGSKLGMGHVLETFPSSNLTL